MDLVNAMNRLGFTKYESLAYGALLKLGPVTGYELGKRSGVPLSKSYVTLQRLVEKGAAVVEQADPPKYAPVAPETLAAVCRAGFMADIGMLLRAAEMLRPDREDSHIWCVTGRVNVLSLVGELIRESEDRIWLEVDPADLLTLRPYLDEARERIRVDSFEPRTGATVAVKARRLILLSDDRKILAGTTEPEDECRAVSTRNAGLVMLGLDYFRRLASAAVASDLAPSRRGIREDWLAWEDRKHRDLVGSLN